MSFRPGYHQVQDMLIKNKGDTLKFKIYGHNADGDSDGVYLNVAEVRALRDYLTSVLPGNERLRAALELISAPGNMGVDELKLHARQALRAADETPAVPAVDVPKLQTDLELAHAAINRVYTGEVRDVLSLLAREEISTAKAHEWITAFVTTGRRDPLPGDADKTASETTPHPVIHSRSYHVNGTYWNGVPTVDLPCDFCGQPFIAHKCVTHDCPADKTNEVRK